MNEPNLIFEYLRLIAYPLGMYALIMLAQASPKVSRTLYAVALYFLTWAVLLIVQQFSPEKYRIVANVVSTPALFYVVSAVFLNVYLLRKE